MTVASLPPLFTDALSPASAQSARTTIEVLERLALRDRSLMEQSDWQAEMVRLNALAKSAEQENQVPITFNRR